MTLFLEQILEERKRFQYKIEHLSIETLAGIYPFYELNHKWLPSQQSKFIEWIFLGLPVNPIYIVSRGGQLDVGYCAETIDGAKRISALKAFVCEDLVLSGLHRLKCLNGVRFKDLPEEEQEQFKSNDIQVVVFENGTIINDIDYLSANHESINNSYWDKHYA